MYGIIFDNKIDKETRTIPKDHLKRIMEKIGNLSENPIPATSTKLVNTDGYRIRIGDYRVIYTVDEINQIVCIFIKLVIEETYTMISKYLSDSIFIKSGNFRFEYTKALIQLKIGIFGNFESQPLQDYDLS